jgi:tRNA A37 threonylcarbamoyladenosine synthetase subunit TsaC/SUA5/YrdC
MLNPEKERILANTLWFMDFMLKEQNIPDLITAVKIQLQFNVPNHPVTLALLKQLPFLWQQLSRQTLLIILVPQNQNT